MCIGSLRWLAGHDSLLGRYRDMITILSLFVSGYISPWIMGSSLGPEKFVELVAKSQLENFDRKMK
jgi:hypothetical protein